MMKMNETIQPIRRADAHEPLLAGQALHLDEELVERVLVLVVPALASAFAALPAERVELVDEDDSPALGVATAGEELTHTRGAHAHVALDELGTRRGEEVDPGLGGERLGEQRLAGAGRAVQ